MSARTKSLLATLGVLVLLGGLAAGYALFRDGVATRDEAILVGGLLVLGAGMIDPRLIPELLARLVRAAKGEKPGGTREIVAPPRPPADGAP